MKLIYNENTNTVFSANSDFIPDAANKVIFDGTEISFNNLTPEIRAALPDSAKDSLVELLTRKCRAKTISRIRSIVNYNLSSTQHYGILNRLMLDVEYLIFSYTAGQSYPDEIRTLREIFLGKH